MLLRIHPNMYADLTGAPGGWLEQIDAPRLRQFFYSRGAVQKLVFGTDVHWRDVDWSIKTQEGILKGLDVTADDSARFWGGTAERWWKGTV